MQNHERVSFIKSLEIVTEAPSASTEASANVVNNQIIMFAAGLNQQHKNDVLNSLSLAHAAASAKYDRRDRLGEWYEKLREVLEILGWELAGTFSVDWINLSGRSGTGIDAVILEHLQTKFGVSETRLIGIVMERLKSPFNKKSSALLHCAMSDTINANVAVGSCKEIDGKVVCDVGYYRYNINHEEEHSSFLWGLITNDHESNEGQFESGSQRMVLNSSVYSTIRDTVLAKLSGMNQALVEEIVM